MLLYSSKNREFMQATKKKISKQPALFQLDKHSIQQAVSLQSSWIRDDVLNIAAILLSSLEPRHKSPPKMYNLTDLIVAAWRSNRETTVAVGN